MARSPVLSPVQRMAQGVSKLTDNNPSNNMDGMKDIAVGAMTAVSISAHMLDRYLQQKNMSLSQLSLPGVSNNVRRNLGAQQLANHVVSSAVSVGLKNAMKPKSAEEKQSEQQEAERKASLAKDKEKQIREAQVAAAREAERKRFMRGDNGLEEHRDQQFASRKNPAKVSIV